MRNLREVGRGDKLYGNAGHEDYAWVDRRCIVAAVASDQGECGMRGRMIRHLSGGLGRDSFVETSGNACQAIYFFKFLKILKCFIYF